MWRDYFSKARVVGLDIKPAARSHAGERVMIEIGDASDPAVLANIASQYGPFDLVIDDGSHRWQHQILAFECLFASLRPRGVFIIEDLHTSYFSKYGTPGAEPATAWLQRHLDLLLAAGNEPDAPKPDGSAGANIWRKQVRQCTFLRKAAIIQRV